MKLNLTKNQKIGTGVGVLAVIGTVLGIRKARKNKRENDFSNDADIMNIQVSPGGKPSVASFPLKFGHRGNNVKKLQSWLNNQIGKIAMRTGVTLPTLKVDGIFGKNTLKAVRTTFKSDEVTKASFDKNRM